MVIFISWLSTELTLRFFNISEGWRVWIDTYEHWENVTSNIAYESVTATRQCLTNSCYNRRFPNSTREHSSIRTCEVNLTVLNVEELTHNNIFDYFHRNALHSLRVSECFTSETEFRKEVVERLRAAYSTWISKKNIEQLTAENSGRANAIKQVLVHTCVVIIITFFWINASCMLGCVSLSMVGTNSTETKYILKDYIRVMRNNDFYTNHCLELEENGIQILRQCLYRLSESR